MNTEIPLFENVNPSKSPYIGAGTGKSGLTYYFTIAQKHHRSEIYIDVGDKDRNEIIFDAIKEAYDGEKYENDRIEWERLETKKACRIKIENKNFNIKITLCGKMHLLK